MSDIDYPPTYGNEMKAIVDSLGCSSLGIELTEKITQTYIQDPVLQNGIALVLQSGMSDSEIKDFNNGLLYEIVQAGKIELNVSEDRPLVLVAHTNTFVGDILARNIQKDLKDSFQNLNVFRIPHDNGSLVHLAAMSYSPGIVVVSSILMIGSDGRSLTRSVRNIPTLQQMPIVMVTAMARKADIAEGIAAGITNYITIPFNAREDIHSLTGTVGTHLKRLQEI